MSSAMSFTAQREFYTRIKYSNYTVSPIVIPLMKFEYDTAKSVANREKHGIDFDEAQALWDDPYLIEAPANVADEQRFLVFRIVN